jgi:methylenetetrahydrofolate reductase (NADPH)
MPMARCWHGASTSAGSLPFEPTEILSDLAKHKAANPDFAVERVHLFPLGGITATTDYTTALAARPMRARA